MPTPLTDVFADQSFMHRVDEMNKLYDFARQLERDLSTLRKENEKLLADKRAAERRAAIWMSMIHGLPAEINERFHDAAKQFDERAALASLRSELAKTTPTTPETPAPHPG